MSEDFHDKAVHWLAITQRDARAWLGALQFAVYSRPQPSGVPVHGEEGAPAQGRQARTVSDQWFEQVQHQVDGALKGLENALRHEWEKRRDPRRATPESQDDFAHVYEEKIAALALAVLEAGDVAATVPVLSGRQVRGAFAVLKEDLRNLVGLYTDHGYEMTFNDARPDSLLSLRARIMADDSRTL